MIRSATSAVHPVWCIAPRPAPLSPWKYSKNRRLSRQAGVRLQLVDSAVDRSASVGAGQPDTDQPVGQVAGDVPQTRASPGPGRVLQGEVRAEEFVVLQQFPDDQVVDREPHRAAPVGVAPVHRGAGLGRFVADGRLRQAGHRVRAAVAFGEGPAARAGTGTRTRRTGWPGSGPVGPGGRRTAAGGGRRRCRGLASPASDGGLGAQLGGVHRRCAVHHPVVDAVLRKRGERTPAGCWFRCRRTTLAARHRRPGPRPAGSRPAADAGRQSPIRAVAVQEQGGRLGAGDPPGVAEPQVGNTEMLASSGPWSCTVIRAKTSAGDAFA